MWAAAGRSAIPSLRHAHARRRRRFAGGRRARSRHFAGWGRPLRDRRIERALALLEQDLSKYWTVEQLARAVGLSRPVFAREFVRLLELSPMRYLALELARRCWHYSPRLNANEPRASSPLAPSARNSTTLFGENSVSGGKSLARAGRTAALHAGIGTKKMS